MPQTLRGTITCLFIKHMYTPLFPLLPPPCFVPTRLCLTLSTSAHESTWSTVGMQMQKDAHCSTVNSNKNGKKYECLKRAWFGKQGHIHLMECCTVFLNDCCKDYVVTSKKHMDFLKKLTSPASFLKKLLEDVFLQKKQRIGKTLRTPDIGVKSYRL